MERTMWVPCGGSEDATPIAPKNHIGEVRRENPSGVFELSDEWLTWQEAIETYAGIILSSSHTVCPSCSDAKEASV